MEPLPRPTPSPLLTARLRLRPIIETDAPFIRALLNEPSFLQYIGDRGVRTEEDARGYIAKGPVVSYERYGFGLLLVQQREDDTPVGMCGLLKREGLDDPDLGFAFLPAYWGKGYATEAAGAVLATAWTTFSLPRVAAIVQPDNAASLQVLARHGFVYERPVTLPGGTIPLHLLVRARG